MLLKTKGFEDVSSLLFLPRVQTLNTIFVHIPERPLGDAGQNGPRACLEE